MTRHLFNARLLYRVIGFSSAARYFVRCCLRSI